MTRYCGNCGQPLPPIRDGRQRQQRYCSARCRINSAGNRYWRRQSKRLKLVNRQIRWFFKPSPRIPLLVLRATIVRQIGDEVLLRSNGTLYRAPIQEIRYNNARKTP